MSLMAEMNEKALKLGLPLSVHLDLTYRCNERCVHCYLDHDDHGEMTTAEITDVLTQLAHAGVFFLSLSGGEVLLRRDFFQIVEHARKLLFNVKIKTNATMIGEKEAARLRELGVEQIQISVYSHRAAVHDAITKLPGSLDRTIRAIRFLKSQGLKVSISNVLMAGNFADQQGVVGLAKELGVAYAVDPTITPKMDGDTSILALRIASSELKADLPKPGTRWQCGRILRSPTSTRGRRNEWIPVQRRAHGLLHLSLRRRFSLRAISLAQRQRAPAEISRYLASLSTVKRGPLYSRPRSSNLFDLQSRGNVHTLSWVSLHGGKYARPFDGRLRKIIRENRHSIGKYVEEGEIRLDKPADSDSTAARFRIYRCELSRS